MIYLSPRSAWLEIASAFSTSTNAKAQVRGITVDGICEAIAHLWMVDAITKDTRKEMLAAVRNHRLYTPGYYIWPTTRAGAVERASFCRAQADMELVKVRRLKVRRRKKALERTR
ncbi:MAG TPA: hypothetical protein VFE62_20940 [Gemmataceae bacterium]|nr:hypothetical protein [Gemmataceae bacterium]